MKIVLLIALALFAVTAWDSELEWENFKVKYEKSYVSEFEEGQRFEIFKENYQRAEEINERDTSVPGNRPFGITKFSDLTPDEFAAGYLSPMGESKNTNNVVAAAPLVDVPTQFDWRNNSYPVVSAVKNQEQCGSCWAFSAVETTESVCALAGYGLKILSEQQVVDCDTQSNGCGGGIMENAYTYIENFGGIETEADYPYVAQNTPCTAKVSETVPCKIASYKMVSSGPGDEPTMQSFLVANSPLAIACDASTWQYYTGGVIMAGHGCGTQLDHGIQIVGYAVVNGVTAWTVRNSWGASWGNAGYLYVEMGHNVCGIAENVSVPCVAKKGDASTTIC